MLLECSEVYKVNTLYKIQIFKKYLKKQLSKQNCKNTLKRINQCNILLNGYLNTLHYIHKIMHPVK